MEEARRALIAAALAALREEQGPGLEERARALAEVLAGGQPLTGEAWVSARAEAHRLRGTAGSYGYAALTVAAGKVEDALGESRSSPVTAAERAALAGELLRSIADPGTPM